MSAGGEYPKAAVRDAITSALAGSSTSRSRRHPCEVTSDRLAGHVERFHALLDGVDRDAVARVRQLLERLAEYDVVSGR